MKAIKLTFVFGLIVMVAWSCSDSVSPENGDGFGKVTYANATKISCAAVNSSSPTDSIIDFARKIPGFGGMFINGDGQFTIYLTHPAKQKAKAKEVLLHSGLITEALSNTSASVANMKIKKGQYTFLQLYK